MSPDLSKLLAPGQDVKIVAGGISVTGKVVQSSVVEFERKDRIRFLDGSEKWVNQAMVRAFLTAN